MIPTHLIPLDKSWMIRMGVLDLIHGRQDILNFLKQQEDISEDLDALESAVSEWNYKTDIFVGESGTLFRFLQFYSWKSGAGKNFIKTKTLVSRKICDDPSIVTWPQRKLLELDHGTSQWASAAALAGDPERLEDAPFKLKVTYEAIDHWNAMWEAGMRWEPRYDETITKQAECFIKLLRGEKPGFEAVQAEDYCFARTFGLVTKEYGEKMWPNLRGHESDRIIETEVMLSEVEKKEAISSKDHRIIQAGIMKQVFEGKNIYANHFDSVRKSWPQFIGFIIWADENKWMV